jgi:hypothetical protein
MISKGTLLKVRTKTRQDTFGEVLYEVTEIGLPAPEKGREGQMDGVKCVMLGGSGPSARKGYTVPDSEFEIQKNIASGITTIIPPEQREKIIAIFGDKGKGGQKKCGSGIEVEL